MTECEILTAVADAIPLFRDEALGVSIFYRVDGPERQDIHATWRDGKWLWTLRDKTSSLKGYGYAESGKDAMRMAVAAARGYKEILAEPEKAPA